MSYRWEGQTDADAVIRDLFPPRQMYSYSLVNLIRHLAGDKKVDVGRELEISQFWASALDRPPMTGALYVPTRTRPRAEGLDTKTDAAGHYTVGTQVQDLIELLRARTKVIELGARFLTGLVSSLSFPVQSSGSAASWVAENPGTDVGPTDAVFAQRAMSPKMLSSTTSYSRKLLQQSSIDIEAFVRTDLATAHAMAIDAAALNGSGSTNQPRGILQTTGIGSLSLGGVAPTYGDMVGLETAIADANADETTMRYLTTPKMRGKLRRTEAFTNGGIPVWVNIPGRPGVGDVAGYEAHCSRQVPQNLGGSQNYHVILLGAWNEVLIGEWGVIEIIVDPFSLKKQAQIELTSYQMCDIVVRQPACFAACQDTVPTP